MLLRCVYTLHAHAGEVASACLWYKTGRRGGKRAGGVRAFRLRQNHCQARKAEAIRRGGRRPVGQVGSQ